MVFGRLHIVPRLPAFLARHPDLSIDLANESTFYSTSSNKASMSPSVWVRSMIRL